MYQERKSIRNALLTIRDKVSGKQKNTPNLIMDIQKIIDRQQYNGGKFWSRSDHNIYAPYGSSTIDTLFVLGELGLNHKDFSTIEKAIDFIFAYQSRQGSFTVTPKGSPLPCTTARIISALGQLGVASDSRLEKSFNWLLETQWDDGGWRCATVKFGKSPLTDASNPGTTLYVLDAFRFRNNNIREINKLNKGVDFLLQHWEIRQPIRPVTLGSDTDSCRSSILS